jgi:hypothetical protein
MVALSAEMMAGDAFVMKVTQSGVTPVGELLDVVNPGYYWSVTYAREIGCDDGRRPFGRPAGERGVTCW